MKQVCIIGVGLIGGSFALDLKQYINGVRVLGIDQNEAHLTDALELGIIDQIGTFDRLMDADLVVLAIPVNAAIKALPQVLELIADHTR